MKFIITEDDLCVEESYKLKKKSEMVKIIDSAKLSMPESKVFNRSDFSLLSEWRMHNLMYEFHIKRDRTKDVDLDTYESKWHKLLYCVFGTLYYVFHF